jgi:type VI secretion system protein ImpG
MNIKKYFEREYNFLQQEGDHFAEKHQGIAGELRMSQRHRKDPFVERLFEAFAFLAGRIHERLDDDFPEITGGLLEQLFPHFLRPFPACAILQARPLSKTQDRPILVKRGCEVQTPTGKYKVKYKVTAGPREKERVIEKSESAEFIFRTTQDMTVRPMELKEVKAERKSDATSSLTIRIDPFRNVPFPSLELGRLTLFLHGSDFVKFTLLHFFAQHVEEIHMRELTGAGADFQKIPYFTIGIPGVSDTLGDEPGDFALIPYAKQVFSGYRLLHEYFAFPERFFFIAVKGLDSFQSLGESHPIEIKFVFRRKLSPECKPTAQNVLLHCTPIVNLFDRPTEEVIVEQRLPEYYVLPDGDRRKSREIYAISQITGIGEDKTQQYGYLPITSYDILESGSPEYEYKRFYSVFTRPLRGDMAETYIRLFGPSMEADVFPKETLSIGHATQSNGFLPAKYLGAGAINQPLDFPEGLVVENLTTPTEILACPEQKNFLWALISHLTQSYTSLADAEAFKTILTLYNWTQDYNDPARKRIQAIKHIHKPVTKYIMHEQGLIRGIEFRIDVDETQFENGPGDIHLFGSVINRFLAQYVTINSFVSLTISETGTNKTYTWIPKSGTIQPV